MFLDALQAPLQKIDLQRLLPHLPFQLRHACFVPASLPAAGKRIARSTAEFVPPAVQHFRSYFKRPRYFRTRRPRFKPLDAASFNFFVNFRRTSPMSPFSIR